MTPLGIHSPIESLLSLSSCLCSRWLWAHCGPHFPPLQNEMGWVKIPWLFMLYELCVLSWLFGNVFSHSHLCFEVDREQVDTALFYGWDRNCWDNVGTVTQSLLAWPSSFTWLFYIVFKMWEGDTQVTDIWTYITENTGDQLECAIGKHTWALESDRWELYP